MISDAEARIWTRLGPRGAYGQALLKVAATRQEVIAISADLLGSSGLDRFSQEYPERCVSVGIAEQQMVGFAAGLAFRLLDKPASALLEVLLFRRRRWGAHFRLGLSRTGYHEERRHLAVPLEALRRLGTSFDDGSRNGFRRRRRDLRLLFFVVRAEGVRELLARHQWSSSWLHIEMGKYKSILVENLS